MRSVGGATLLEESVALLMLPFVTGSGYELDAVGGRGLGEGPGGTWAAELGRLRRACWGWGSDNGIGENLAGVLPPCLGCREAEALLGVLRLLLPSLRT